MKNSRYYSAHCLMSFSFYVEFIFLRFFIASMAGASKDGTSTLTSSHASIPAQKEAILPFSIRTQF